MEPKGRNPKVGSMKGNQSKAGAGGGDRPTLEVGQATNRLGNETNKPNPSPKLVPNQGGRI